MFFSVVVSLRRPFARTLLGGAVMSLLFTGCQLPWAKVVDRSSAQPVVSPQVMTGQVTNQWYSSLYFDDWSKPLFAYPLAFQLSPAGIGVSYPQVSTSPKTIFAPYVEQVTLGLSHNLDQKAVINADPASIAVKLCSGAECMSTRFTHGSPVVTVFAETAVTLSVKTKDRQDVTFADQSVRFKVGTAKYLLTTTAGLSDKDIKADDKQWSLALATGSKAFLALEPNDATLSRQQVMTTINGTGFEPKLDGQNLSATLKYYTNSNDDPALVALLPHQWASLKTAPIGTYQSIRGTMKLYQTTEIKEVLAAPKLVPYTVMVAALGPRQRLRLHALLEQEVTEALARPLNPNIYDGGKQIYQLAQLYDIAEASQSPRALLFKSKLTEFLRTWLAAEPGTKDSPFQFTTEPKGVIAKKSQYGNDVFNDHHFHYGYFLAAAGIAMNHDASLAAQLKPGLDALLVDITNTDVSNGYPYLRNFDPYESHSWADGHGTTGDGNNQESSSEAINRWYGMILTGQALNNTELIQAGTVGLAMEQQAASIYWLGQEPTLYQFPTGYEHPMASLVWGGKLDYGTWFSGRPSHIFGIQFLPLTPAMAHISKPDTFAKYQEYTTSDDPEAWDDLYYMVAAANGATVPETQPKYEAGNTAANYYLWTQYWQTQKQTTSSPKP